MRLGNVSNVLGEILGFQKVILIIGDIFANNETKTDSNSTFSPIFGV